MDIQKYKFPKNRKNELKKEFKGDAYSLIVDGITTIHVNIVNKRHVAYELETDRLIFDLEVDNFEKNFYRFVPLNERPTELLGDNEKEVLRQIQQTNDVKEALVAKLNLTDAERQILGI